LESISIFIGGMIAFITIAFAVVQAWLPIPQTLKEWIAKVSLGVGIGAILTTAAFLITWRITDTSSISPDAMRTLAAEVVLTQNAQATPTSTPSLTLTSPPNVSVTPVPSLDSSQLALTNQAAIATQVQQILLTLTVNP